MHFLLYFFYTGSCHSCFSYCLIKPHDPKQHGDESVHFLFQLVVHGAGSRGRSLVARMEVETMRKHSLFAGLPMACSVCSLV